MTIVGGSVVEIAVAQRKGQPRAAGANEQCGAGSDKSKARVQHALLFAQALLLDIVGQ